MRRQRKLPRCPTTCHENTWPSLISAPFITNPLNLRFKTTFTCVQTHKHSSTDGRNICKNASFSALFKTSAQINHFVFKVRKSVENINKRQLISSFMHRDVHVCFRDKDLIQNFQHKCVGAPQGEPDESQRVCSTFH